MKEAYGQYGRCVICVSEGIRNPQGKLWGEIAGEALANGLKPEAQNLFGEPKVDAFGHFQLSGTGVLADFLAGRIKEGTDVSRVRADTFGYLQRSFPGFASKVDAKEAREVGRAAVKYAAKGLDGSVAIKRKPGKTYKAYYELVDLKLVAGQEQGSLRRSSSARTAGTSARRSATTPCRWWAACRRRRRCKEGGRSDWVPG